jgi:HD-like signal output (HDOD) protein/ActR/RegA family two-component response regulator
MSCRTATQRHSEATDMQTKTQTILFVDSDDKQRQSLQQTLREFRDKWQIHYANDADQALEIMQQKAVDIVVSETRLCGKQGSELLKEIQLHHPSTTRLLFSAQAMRTPAQEIVHHAHQFIAKPCNSDELINILERIFYLRSLLNNPSVEEMINSLGTLPSLPSTYQQMITALQSDSTTLKDIGRIVAQDIGMSAKILQMVNSAFFGLPQQIASPEHAVTLLGIETVTNLALSAGVFTQLDTALIAEFQLEQLLQHSLLVSGLVQRLCQAAGMDKQACQIPTLAGLMHDLGKLLLATQDSAEYRRIKQQSVQDNVPMYVVESESLWCNHATIGAYLMGLWGLPFSAVEAVALHHTANKQSRERLDCLTLYAANLLINRSTDVQCKDYYSTQRLESLLTPDEFTQWRSITEEYLNRKAS